MSIQVLKDKCTGCKLCVKACPFAIIEIKDKLAIIDLARCNLCGACVDACNVDAIKLEKDISATHRLNAEQIKHYNDVWVFAESREGIAQSVVFELLGKGRELADKLGVKLALFI